MEKLWRMFERILRFIIYNVLHMKLKEENWDRLCQFMKFGIVGLSNTLISYVVYAILVAFGVYYLAASIVGFLVSVINAYYWNNKYVFETDDGERRIWWKVFMKTFLAYAGTGLVLNNILLIFWVDFVKIPEMLGPIINLVITIPLNFLLNKFWAFRKSKEN